MSGTDELWQAYNEQGEQTPAPDSGGAAQAAGLRKAEARKGVLHGAAHVWLWRMRGGHLELLLQKRSDGVSTWPGYFDVSAAGHINYSETPVAAAVREVREELGFQFQPADLELLFVNRARMIVPSTGIIDNEHQFVYAVHASHNGVPNFADGEVSSSIWANHQDMQDIIANARNQQMVPHGAAYFTMLFERLYQLGELIAAPAGS